MNRTAESVEAEAAVIRLQLVTAGTDLRHRADPAILMDAAKASFKRRTENAPTFLKENATPIGMVMLGGAFGAVVTGLFSQIRKPPATPEGNDKSYYDEGVPPLSPKSRIKAALLSAMGVGLGYVGGMFIPTLPAEEQLFGQPKAVLSERLDDFLKEHMRGMKLAAANLFGASRFSAATLVGLAMLGEALATPRGSSKTDSP